MSNGTIPTLKSLSPSAMNMLNGSSPAMGSVQAGSFKSVSVSRGSPGMAGVSVRPKGCGFEISKPTSTVVQEPVYRKRVIPGVQKYECRPVKSCDPCPPKKCPEPCDPCDSGYGGIWWAVICFIILALIIWALLWAFRPEFVLQDDKHKKSGRKGKSSHGSKSPRGHGSKSPRGHGDDHDDHDDHDGYGKHKSKDDREVDQGRACLWAVIIALVLTFLFYLAWGCVCGNRSRGSW